MDAYQERRALEQHLADAITSLRAARDCAARLGAAAEKDWEREAHSMVEVRCDTLLLSVANVLGPLGVQHDPATLAAMEARVKQRPGVNRRGPRMTA